MSPTLFHAVLFVLCLLDQLLLLTIQSMKPDLIILANAHASANGDANTNNDLMLNSLTHCSVLK